LHLLGIRLSLPAHLCPTYRSGDDYVVAAGPIRLSFSEADFADRVVTAAERLGFIGREGLDGPDREDLVALAARGRIDRPGSGLAAHVEAFGPQLRIRERDLVQWLRRVVVRDAWVDSQVVAGRLVPVLDDDGFDYRDPGRPSQAIVAGEPIPDMSELAYTGTT
jgi:hypothetical protein